ncbi:MAG: hypothetical protein WCT28_04105 [Patescibacteria group bacterium]|jgi:hypothetical protein
MFSPFFLVLFSFTQPTEAATPAQVRQLVATVEQVGIEMINTIIGNPNLTVLLKTSIFTVGAPACGTKTFITVSSLEHLSLEAGRGIPIWSLHIMTEVYPGETISIMDFNADGVVDSVAPDQKPLPADTQATFDKIVTCVLTP